MAIPIAWAVAALAVGVGIEAYGQYQTGQSQKEWSEYNAAVARQQGENAKAAAEIEERQKRRQKEAFLSQQRARYLASGVTMEGSPLAAMEDTAANFEMDALLIRKRGELGLWSAEQQAALSVMEGKAAARAGKIGATSTLLTGAGEIASFKMKSAYYKAGGTGKMKVGGK